MRIEQIPGSRLLADQIGARVYPWRAADCSRRNVYPARRRQTGGLLEVVKRLASALLVLSTVGCVSMERLVDVPAQPGLATVDSYNTQLHRQSVHIFNPIALDQRVAELRLEPRVDNLFFLIDQSAAMSGQTAGVGDRLYAREMLRRFFQTMPERTYSGALMVFRPADKPRYAALRLQQFTAGELVRGLDQPDALQRVDSASLEVAIDQVSALMSQIEGSSALVLVTSWEQVGKPVERAVMRMRQRNRFDAGLRVLSSAPETRPWSGQRRGVCLYTLGVGNQLSRTRLETVDSCGYSVAANKVAQPRDMAHFVQNVLFKGPADSDGDGIYDYRDLCPNTPAQRIVDYSGCLRFAAAE